MLTLSLDTETEHRLAELANITGKTPAEIVRDALRTYQVQKSDLATDWLAYAGRLKDSPNFNADPVEIQQAMRDGWQ